MTDKTYIRILEQYIFSQGNTKADLMAFIINHINELASIDSAAIAASDLDQDKPKPQKRRTRKFK